ncbi:ShlB/FhaC/HecB family hemolysin secretion/activation protein, partial [Salmonella enterica subsp. enterica serovar Miami]
MNSLLKWTGVLRPQKVRCLPFILTPLALLTCAGTYAAPVVPGAGALGNQLRQEKNLTPPPPASAPLVLPEEGQVRKALSSDSRTT